MDEAEFAVKPLWWKIRWVLNQMPSPREGKRKATVDEFAAAIGVTAQTVYELKRTGSMRVPEPENLQAIADLSPFGLDAFVPEPEAEPVTLEDVYRRLGEVEELVQKHGAGATRALSALARDLRALARRLDEEDGQATAGSS